MAQILNTLNKEILNKYQKFDPDNKEHVIAYKMLRYDGRQHPKYRFHLEEPFLDVLTMMMYRLAEKHMDRVLTTASE